MAQPNGLCPAANPWRHFSIASFINSAGSMAGNFSSSGLNRRTAET
jgi:hypothetical protein